MKIQRFPMDMTGRHRNPKTGITTPVEPKDFYPSQWTNGEFPCDNDTVQKVECSRWRGLRH
jgi:hypothetical protein